MGVGFIQLFSVGNEEKIFNYNPNISFFKIYYRRHTNFFINNIIINSQRINLDNNPNMLEKKINLNIPLDGDLLTKSYIQLRFDKYYFELFKYIGELYSTLNTSIISLYDNYYIKVNNYSLNNIKFIQTIRIVYENKSNLIIRSNITDNIKIIDLIKNEKFISIQEDNLGIFYNIDLTNNYYSLKVKLITNLKDDQIFDYLYKNIDYLNLNYINIDIPDINLSMRVIYYNKKNYKLFIDTLYSDEYIGYIYQIIIEKNYVYYNCSYSSNFLTKIIELLYLNIEKVEMEVITGKYESNYFINNVILYNNII